MSTKSDYIPKKDSEPVAWSANFTAGAEPNFADYQTVAKALKAKFFFIHPYH